MNIEIKEKMIPTKFVIIDDEEFELGELICSLDEISSRTEENDDLGDYSLRDYELSFPNTMDKLVKLGLVKNYTGSRQANLYCLKDAEGVDRLLETLYDLTK